MAKFLTRQEIYRLLQRESPEDLYPDGAPSAFFSTADQDSMAEVLATSYANLERIYINNYPQDADERLADWEVKVFGRVQDASLTVEQRQDAVVTRLRRQLDLTRWNLLKIVAGFVPEGTYVEIVNWHRDKGTGKAWSLGVSLLGVDTNLDWDDWDQIIRDDICDYLARGVGWRLGSDGLGVSTYLATFENQYVSDIQRRAYMYEVRVYDYTLDSTSLSRLEKELTAVEPGRSAHITRQNVVMAYPNQVTDVDQFSGVDCVTRDSTSSTGFSGRTI